MDGSVFVDGIVQCWEKGFKGSGSGEFDKEVIGIDWIIRVVKEVETEGRGRIIGIVGWLLWTIRDGLIWGCFRGIWGLNVLIWDCASWDGVLNGVCAAGSPEGGWQMVLEGVEICLLLRQEFVLEENDEGLGRCI